MKKKVTVYGSLLEGLGNWYGFLNNDQSTKLGEHVLEGKFKMISLGGFPGLISDSSMTEDNKIFVETYEVSEDIYHHIEHLEGYPHFYDKTKIDTPFGKSEVYTLEKSVYGNDHLVPADENGIINWKKYKLR